MKKVVIVGGGFAGLNAAKRLGRCKEVEVTLIDKRNHHLFQPLLYQVAMAGLSPAEIAAPIRSLLAGYSNTRVIQGLVETIDQGQRQVGGAFGKLDYDYLILACGASHNYFGRDYWEPHAPGLKTLEQATEIRRRVLTAFERAETETDAARRREWLTFAIVGAGPTGVELAGAIGEMSRFTLARDFRRIDPKLTRVILIEAGPRILPAFRKDLASRATRDLEKLGVQVWTESRVTGVDGHGLTLGDERVTARTVLWAAGVQAASIGQLLDADRDRLGRVVVQGDLSLERDPNVFVLGDMAQVKDQSLPGVAPVAMQQGRHVARTIIEEIRGQTDRAPFVYLDKGSMATIGRTRAVLQVGRIKLTGWIAWMAWLVVHIYYLTGFRNRLFVVMQWAWSYFSFRKGARLITRREWRTHSADEADPEGSR